MFAGATASEVTLRDWMRVLADKSSSPEAVMFAAENVLTAFRQLRAQLVLQEAKRARLELVK